MRILAGEVTVIVCKLVVLWSLHGGETVGGAATSESEPVHRVLERLEKLNRVGTSAYHDDFINRINYDVYVTPVMSPQQRAETLRSKNPLLSWLANVLTFGGAATQTQTTRPEVALDEEPEKACPKCSKYAIRVGMEVVRLASRVTLGFTILLVRFAFLQF